MVAGFAAVRLEIFMPGQITFLVISGASAFFCLFFPTLVIKQMYRISKFMARVQNTEFPDFYEKNYQLLNEDPEAFERKYKAQIGMMRGTGAVSMFLFLSALCLFPG